MRTDLGTLNLKSLVFLDGGYIPLKYTCLGQSFIPPLVISGAPSETKTLALILHDPDSPTKDFTHWLIWNLPKETTDLNITTDMTSFTQGKNDFNKLGYGAPCPNKGNHHYIFELFALDTYLNLENEATRVQLESSIRDHILDTTTLVGIVSHD